MDDSPSLPLRRPTVDDVARALRLSKATISNAFNRPQLLSTETLERIHAHCREVGYFGPDPVARAMRRPELHEMAVVFHHDLRYALGDPLSVAFMQGVAQELDQRHLSMHIIPRLGRRLNLAAAFQLPSDAIILHANVPEDLVPQVKAIRKPLVLVDHSIDGVTSIGIDDFGGARQAMEYALGKRPDHVLVVGLPAGALDQASPWLARSGESIGEVRRRGYLAALQTQQRSADSVQWHYVSDDEPEAVTAGTLEVLRQCLGSGSTALLCMSDRIALALLRWVRAQGLPNPQSVVGFDDIPDAALHGLSTVRQDAHHKGVCAVRAVLDGSGSQVLPTTLVVRKT
ncbi:MAG: LacI family DNA-binding transcriptional regulator [Rhodoferax sp.]